MSSSLDKLKALTSRLEEKLESKEKQETTVVTEVKETITKPIVIPTKKLDMSGNNVRENNIIRVQELYNKLHIVEKSPNFDTIFNYKAMNLSGVGLKEEDFAQIREGKYIQIIAITYEADKNGKKKAKNISLGYFGKAETIDGTLKNEIIEFVLRWRYEKAFQNVEHYKVLISKVDVSSEGSI